MVPGTDRGHSMPKHATPKPAELASQQRRNRAFEETHAALIETAVRLIGEKGAEALSIAALARASGVNRTTVYYHFASREALVAEVKAWSSRMLVEAFTPDRPPQERMEHIYRFVLENPELLRMWIADYLAAGDIRSLYSSWDDLVAGIAARIRGTELEGEVDVEVFCVNLLTTAFIGPLVFRGSVHPEADIETVVERFRRESTRALRSLAIL